MIVLAVKRSFLGILYIPAAAASGLIASTSVLTSLPQDEAGLFFLCQAMLPFMLLFDIGLLVIGTREIAFKVGASKGSGGSGLSSRLLATTLAFRNIRLWAVFVLSLLSFIALAFLLILPSVEVGPNLMAAVISGFAASLILISYSYQSFLEGIGRYDLDRLVSIVTVLISGALVTTAALWKRDVTAVLIAWYLGQAITLLAKAFVGHRILPAIHLPRWSSRRKVGNILRLSSGVFLIQIGATVTKSLQYPMIVHFLGIGAVATYFFVVRVASVLDQAVSVLASSQRAIFSQLIGERRFAEARRLMHAVLLGVAVGAIFAAIALAYGFPLLLRRFAPFIDITAIPLNVIACDIVLMTCSGVMTGFVIASGENPFAKSVISSGVLTVLLLLVLVPAFGLAGAATAQLVGSLVTNGWYSAYRFYHRSKTLSGPQVV